MSVTCRRLRVGHAVLVAGCLAIGSLWPRPGWGDNKVSLTGFVGLEARGFTRTPQFPEQSRGEDYSGIVQPELRYELDTGRISFVPFYRYSSEDSERRHADIRELSWRTERPAWALLVGIDRVFWGVTESRHLVDIVNQTDLLENPDQEDKLGQPMIELSAIRDWGNVSVLVLPGFRQRGFPGPEGRLRSSPPVDADAAQYESGAKDRHVDLALRYTRVAGDWDLGLSYFYGTAREPRLLPDFANGRFVPFYDLIHQGGVDAQYTAGAWLWKFEGIVREGQGKTFAASVFGFEYTFYQIFRTPADLGVLLELHYDGRDTSAPPVLYDGDVFAGLRLGWNDQDDTQLLTGILYDKEGNERFYTLEFSRRLSQHFSLEMEIRRFSGNTTPISPLRRDNYVQLLLAYYF